MCTLLEEDNNNDNNNNKIIINKMWEDFVLLVSVLRHNCNWSHNDCWRAKITRKSKILVPLTSCKWDFWMIEPFSLERFSF